MAPPGIKGLLGVKGPPVSQKLVHHVVLYSRHMMIFFKDCRIFPLCKGHQGGAGTKGPAGLKVTRHFSNRGKL